MTSVSVATEFVRHRGPVTCAAFLPGGHAVVTSAYDGAVGYFTVATRKAELIGYHEHLVNRITVSPDGRHAATASSDYMVYLWDIPARSRIRTLRGHSDDVEDFVFIDRETGASVSRDCSIIIWNLATGAAIRILEGHEKDVLSVVHAGGKLYTSGDDMTLRVWDLESGREVYKWGPFEYETDTCALDLLRNRIILGCDDGILRIFDVDTGATLAEIPAHASGIKKVTTSSRTGDILSAAYDQKIHVWDGGSFQCKVDLAPRPAVWERSFNWSPEGGRIVAGTFDGTVLIWDASSGEFLVELGEKGNGNSCLNDVAADPSGRIATISDDGMVRQALITPERAEWSSEQAPATGRILGNAITMDADRILTGTHNQKVMLFRRSNDSLQLAREVTVGEGPINCIRIATHPGYEGHAFAASYSGAIVELDRAGEIRGRIRLHAGAVKALRLHPVETMGVSCSADGKILSWSFSGELLQEFPGHMAIVDDVDFAPAGDRICSVSRDFTMKVYDFSSGRLLASYPLGHYSPKAVLFLDAGSVIVTNYWGDLLRIDLEADRVRKQHLAGNGISSINRCGELLVAVSYDGTAYLVEPASLKPVNRLPSMTQRLVQSRLIP